MVWIWNHCGWQIARLMQLTSRIRFSVLQVDSILGRKVFPCRVIFHKRTRELPKYTIAADHFISVVWRWRWFREPAYHCFYSIWKVWYSGGAGLTSTRFRIIHLCFMRISGGTCSVSTIRAQGQRRIARDHVEVGARVGISLQGFVSLSRPSPRPVSVRIFNRSRFGPFLAVHIIGRGILTSKAHRVSRFQICRSQSLSAVLWGCPVSWFH